ncbi:hypothetical protein V6Z11_A08G068500 [Gossypium hirsutum]
MGFFEPGGILARNPSSTSIPTKKGGEIHGLLARYGCALVCVRELGVVAGGVVGAWRMQRLLRHEQKTARVSSLGIGLIGPILGRV